MPLSSSTCPPLLRIASSEKEEQDFFDPAIEYQTYLSGRKPKTKNFFFKISMLITCVLAPVPGGEQQLGAGQFGLGGIVAPIPSVRPGQGQAVPL